MNRAIHIWFWRILMLVALVCMVMMASLFTPQAR